MYIRARARARICMYIRVQCASEIGRKFYFIVMGKTLLCIVSKGFQANY